MELVLDAMPLIHAAKTSLHDLFPKLEVRLLTTSAVQEEILRGDFVEKPILESILRDFVQVEDPAHLLPTQKGLHAGESSAIALAKERKAVLVTDDRVARAVAKALGVAAVHSTFFIFHALERKRVSKTQAESLLEELMQSGWWCDAETLARIHAAIRDF